MQSLAMDHQTTLDERGRITIHPDFRDHLGNRIVQVLLPEGVLLRPAARRLSNAHRLPRAAHATGEDEALREVE
jgi:DNA-binding transcriptional regulator/RsmH inhibitor MraZ